jgi:hypothetical protein
MSSNDDMDARHGRILAELAEAGIGLARRLSAASQQSGNNDDFVRLAEAFHTVSRSVRQTIALEFKLRHAPRDPVAPKPEPRPAAAPSPERPERPDQVYWNEYERADWDEPLDALLGSGDRAAINAAVDDSIARIRRDLTQAEGVLTGPHPEPRRPGAGGGQDGRLLRVAPQARPRTRSAWLSTSSRPGLDLQVPPPPGEREGSGKAPHPPPWRRSG